VKDDLLIGQGEGRSTHRTRWRTIYS